jgi:serine/threonine protein kinase
VLHGDVRSSNILVSSNESVYIIDFESSHMAPETLRESERIAVERLLQKTKNELDNSCGSITVDVSSCYSSIASTY